MILPGKHLLQDRALLSVGGDILSVLAEPAAVSEVWERVLAERSARSDASPLPFDWFVLAMSLLYAIRAVDLVEGRLVRAGP